jgi:hypothetical protein
MVEKVMWHYASCPRAKEESNKEEEEEEEEEEEQQQQTAPTIPTPLLEQQKDSRASN